MNTSMRLILVVVSALLVAVIALGYTSFSAAVSLDHARKQQDLQRQREHLLESLLLKLAGNLPRKEVVLLVNKNFGVGHIIKEDKNQVTVDDVVLTFDEGTLIGVSSLDESPKAP
jgi:hypothetical protein